MPRIFLLTFVLNFMACSTALAVSFSADSITPMIAGQTPEIGKIYYKDSKTYRSDTMGIISIVKGSTVYSLVTDTQKFVVQDLADLREKSPVSVWGDASEVIQKNKMEKVGKEKLQGYKCIIYEGDITYNENQPPMRIKLWYSKKLKNMLKQEIALPAPMGVVTSHLENIIIGKQEDSLFEIPSRYTKVNDMSEAMGFGNFSMPAQGNEENKMPSEEDMKKVMEQMQNMMKNMKTQ